MLLRRRSFCSSVRGTPMARQNRPGDVDRRRPVIQSSHVSPPPNCPKSSCRQGLDKHSSPCATEQRSDLEPGGFPSIPPPEKPYWLQSRCLATASHSVKGRGYSHVRTSDCCLDGRSVCVKPQVRGVGPFSGYYRTLAQTVCLWERERLSINGFIRQILVDFITRPSGRVIAQLALKRARAKSASL